MCGKYVNTGLFSKISQFEMNLGVFNGRRLNFNEFLGLYKLLNASLL